MTQADYTSNYLPNFAYTESDLEANRQGMLTQDQFYIVESVYQARQNISRQTYKLFAIWIPLLLIVGFVIEYSQSGKSLGEFLPSALPILLAVGIGLAVLILISVALTAINARDARDKRISVAEGEAQVIEKEARNKATTTMRYELRLNGRLFRFANHASIAHFEDGKSYRVYYVKFYPFPLMLSAEEM
jgi:hypothetical protein